MTSERQNAANRANALNSTGPRTSEGKAAIRFNACRHGLLAEDAVLPGEDEDAFEELRNQVRAELSPLGPIEKFLVDRVVSAMWRLRRLARAETALFDLRIQRLKAERFYFPTGLPQLPPTVANKPAPKDASDALKRARDERDPDEVLLGRAFEVDANQGDGFDKLARYEGNIERSLLRNLNDLRQMQEKRRNRRSSSISDAVILDANDTE